jgi:hypothetical protein
MDPDSPNSLIPGTNPSIVQRWLLVWIRGEKCGDE